MNMHVRSPETGNETIPAALLKQERDRQKALKKLARLRKEARDEIERLISFLDASDTYVMTEIEDDGDQNDASYPTSGAHCANPMEDDEDSDADEDNHDGEPSLGSRSSSGGDQSRWGASDTCQLIDAEDEHDGGEPDDECDGNPDHEPSLGWTTDGVISNTSFDLCDVEGWS